MNELREQLAAYAHEAWAADKKYMFGKCDAGLPSVLFAIPDGSLIIPPELVNRWYRQMNTPYDELPENEKPSDREQADRILAILQEYAASNIQSRTVSNYDESTETATFSDVADEVLEEHHDLWEELAKR